MAKGIIYLYATEMKKKKIPRFSIMIIRPLQSILTNTQFSINSIFFFLEFVLIHKTYAYLSKGQADTGSD